MMDPRPIHSPPVIRPGSPGHVLLRRVLRMAADQSFIERVTVIDTTSWRIALVDTGPEGTADARADRDTSLHVLWATDDDHAALRLGGKEIAISPGDTITLPAGITWSAASGMILCEIAGPHHDHGRMGSGIEKIEATHGEETFHGYNRQTTYPSAPGLTIERWKLTQPLTLPDSNMPYIINDLIDPLALMWRGGVDLVGRGEARFISPSSGPITLIPDGLGYALIVRQTPEEQIP